MRTIVFDVQGPYGHFRKPYAPVSPVTYPFPPPPAVWGLVGAVLGYGKEEYLQRIGWDRARVAVQLLHPVRKYRTALNLINTKDNKFFRLKEENPHSQIPYEFLKDPAFRIWVAEGEEASIFQHSCKPDGAGDSGIHPKGAGGRGVARSKCVGRWI